MSIKRLGLLILMVLFLTSMAGCWDSEDIDSRANVLAIAIDEADSGPEEEDNIAHSGEDPPDLDMFRVTAQVAVPGEVALGPPDGGGGEAEPVWVLSVTAHSLEEAISNMQQEVADTLFLGQLRVIVVNEDVAKQGVERFNESLRRNPQVRRTAWMVVSQEEAAPFMDIAPQLEAIPTLYLANMVENAVSAGKFPEDYIGIFWRMMSSKGREGFLPYLQIRGDEQIQLNGLAYFKGEQMIEATEPVDIGIFMSLLDLAQGGYEFFSPIPETDADVFMDTDSRNTRIETEIKDGKPDVRIMIRYEFTINEKTDVNVSVSDSQTIEQIEKKAEEENIKAIEGFIQDMQEEQSDIFGFGEYVRAKHPDYWNKEAGTNERWQEVFPDLNVDVDVSANIRRVGTEAR